MCVQCDRKTRSTRVKGALILTGIFATLIGHQITSPVLAGTPQRAPMAACTFEDGGTIGPDRQQAFPCLWDATTQSNRTGQSFVLWTDPYAERI